MGRVRIIGVLIVLFSGFYGQAQDEWREKLNALNITSMTQDGWGRLWIGTARGLYCYDDVQLLHFNSGAVLCRLSANEITGLVFHPQWNRIIATTNHGINLIQPELFENTIVQSDKNQPADNAFCYSPAIGKDSTVWVINKANQIGRLSGSGTIVWKTVTVEVDSVIERKYTRRFTLFKVMESGNHLFLGSSNSMFFKIQLPNGRSENISSEHRTITGIKRLRDRLVLSDYDGLHLFDTVKYQKVQSESMHLITDLYQDANEELWVTVDKTSLFKINEQFQVEPVYQLTPEEINKHKAITSVVVQENRIFLGTERGLLTINKPVTAFRKIMTGLMDYSSSELSSRGITSVSDSLVVCAGYNFLLSYNKFNHKIHTLLPKKDATKLVPYALLKTGDSLWIGSEGRGLHLWNLGKSKMESIRFNQRIPPEHFTNAGLITNLYHVDTCMLMVEYGLIAELNLRNKTIYHSNFTGWAYPWFNEFSAGVRQILKTSPNELVLISQGAVCITDRNFHVKKKFRPQAIEASTDQVVVNHISLDSAGNMYLSTRSHGIYYYARNGGKTKRYTVENGLSDNTVYFTVLTGNGKLIAGTNFGLSVMDIASGKFSNYYEKDGVASNEFNTNSYFLDKNGDVYVGGMKGVTRIDPKKLTMVREEAELILSSITLAGSGEHDSVLVAGLNKLQMIELPYHSRFVKVEYTLVNYSDNNRYAYRLLGADSLWKQMGNVTSLVFNSLSPGNYTLQIKAWTSNNDEVSQYLAVPITVEQIFYKKLWFILLALTMFVMVTLLVFYQIYTVKLRSIQQLADMRLKIASDLHDQVGGLLNKTASQAELIKNRSQEQNPTLSKIADNSRIALSSMRDIMWNLDPRNDNPESLVDRMQEYAHQMLDDSNAYEINVGELQTIVIPHETRQIIHTVFKEAINNIVKHAPNEHVKVDVQVNENSIYLCVANSGRFMPKPNSTGQGLKNMRMRVENIGGNFYMDVDQGVSLQFRFPLK